MGRGLTAGIVTQVTSYNSTPILLVDLDLASSGGGFSAKLTNWPRDVSWSSSTWSGNGVLIDVRPVRETNEIKAQGIEIELNGNSSAYLAALFLGAEQGAIADVWLAFLDATGAVIADPTLLFRGKFNKAEISDNDDESQIILGYENELIELERPREVRYTHDNQQARFAGDLGFEYVAKLEDWNGFWGRNRVPKRVKPKKSRT